MIEPLLMPSRKSWEASSKEREMTSVLSENVRLLAYAFIAFDVIFVIQVIFGLIRNNKDRGTQEEVRRCMTSFLIDNHIDQLIDRRLRLKKLADTDKNANGNDIAGK